MTKILLLLITYSICSDVRKKRYIYNQKIIASKEKLSTYLNYNTSSLLTNAKQKTSFAVFMKI